MTARPVSPEGALLHQVVGERRGPAFAPTGWRWHLLDGEGDGDWQPVKCGGGIAFPGHPEQRPESDVCPACLKEVSRG